MPEKPRFFSIYLDNGKILTIESPSLRKALSSAEKQLAGAEVVAALENSCLPPPPSAALPFHAVMLRNPGFEQ